MTIWESTSSTLVPQSPDYTTCIRNHSTHWATEARRSTISITRWNSSLWWRRQARPRITKQNSSRLKKLELLLRQFRHRPVINLKLIWQLPHQFLQHSTVIHKLLTALLKRPKQHFKAKRWLFSKPQKAPRVQVLLAMVWRVSMLLQRWVFINVCLQLRTLLKATSFLKNLLEATDSRILWFNPQVPKPNLEGLSSKSCMTRLIRIL